MTELQPTQLEPKIDQEGLRWSKKGTALARMRERIDAKFPKFASRCLKPRKSVKEVVLIQTELANQYEVSAENGGSQSQPIDQSLLCFFGL
jgi:hypothetical protein